MNECFPCELHEQRLTTIEIEMKDLADTTKRLDLLAARAVGAISVPMLIQPIVTGLILYCLTNQP